MLLCVITVISVMFSICSSGGVYCSAYIVNTQDKHSVQYVCCTLVY
jgi:hypothetical protein